MAEGFIRKHAADLNVDLEVVSAGVETHGVNPKAIQVMQELGIDISGHTSDHVDQYLNGGVTHLFSVCDHAVESCPVFPEQVIRIHNTFPDPAKATGSPEEILNAFRSTRDSINTFTKTLVSELKK